MISLITTCLLLVNAVASLAISQGSTLKILSPAPGTNIQLGVSLNVTLQIEKESMSNSKQVLLGFGLSSVVSENPTSLGEVFLGVLNTTHTPFSPSGQLTWSLSIPPREKLNSTSSSFSLVVSQYMYSGATNTPGCGLVSVLVNVASQGSDSVGSGKGASKPWLPTNPSSNYMSHASNASPKAGSPVSKSMSATSMSATPPMAKSQPVEHVNMTKPEIKASITAEGHNTAETILGTGMGDKPSSPSTSTSTSTSKTNVTSTPTTPAGKTATVTPPPAKKNATTTSSESESGAAHLGISTSHVIATLAVLSSIFATV